MPVPAKADLHAVYGVIRERMGADPAESYVARLLAGGPDAVLQKVGEESCELIIAAKNGDRAATVHELADLWFHVLVCMAQAGITPEDVEGELGRRFGRSGLAPRTTQD
jgi:phosphoribosyl-ATP pyrophosphohydrolase